MEDISEELLKALPMEPRKEVADWISSNNRFQKNYLVYRAAYVPALGFGQKTKMIECRCTACGQTFYQGYSRTNDQIAFLDDDFNEIKSGDCAPCPNCGEKISAWHISKVGKYGIVDYSWPCEFMMIGEYPALIQWRVENAVNKQGTKTYRVRPYEAYVFVQRKTYSFKCWYKYFTRFNMLDCYEYRKAFTDTFGSLTRGDMFPLKKYFFDGSFLENAKIYEFIRDSQFNKCYLVEYIRTYLWHRQVENLVTAGASRIVNDLIYANSNPYCGIWHRINKGVNWKEKRPAQMLGLNKNDFAVMQKEKWDLDTLEYFKKVAADKYAVKAEVFYEFSQVIPAYNFDTLVNFKGLSPVRVYNYLKNQRKKHGAAHCDVHTLLDYYRFASLEGYNMDDDGVLFPKNIVKEHDRVYMNYWERRQKEERERREAAAAQRKRNFEVLAKKYKKYEFESGGLMIRIADSEAALIDEGKSLCHCVATYAATHAQGKKCIFFIRKTTDPNTAFYTLELDMEQLSVLQNRGKKNRDRTPEVEAFEAEWLEHIRSLKIRKAG